MTQTIVELFNNFTGMIIFFHVISGVIWVGGMIAIRFAVHQAVQNIEDPKLKFKVILSYLDNFLAIVRPAIGLLIVTAVFMIIGFDYQGSELNAVVYTKLSIWLIMTGLFIVIQLKRKKAQAFFDKNDIKSVKETLVPLTFLFIPANIILGVIAIYLGITLRGF